MTHAKNAFSFDGNNCSIYLRKVTKNIILCFFPLELWHIELGEC